MLLLLAAAFADPVEPPDAGMLEERGKTAFVAPSACGRFRWDVEQTGELVAFGKKELRAEGEARLLNGEWTEARWSVLSDSAPNWRGGRDVDGAVVPFASPSVGKLVGVDPSLRRPPDPEAKAEAEAPPDQPPQDHRAMFERILGALAQDVEILDVQPKPIEGAPGWLVQHWFRLDTRPGPKDNSDVVSFGFDAALQPRTLSLRVGKPRDVGHGARSFRLVRFEMEAALDAAGAPVRETLSVEGVWGLLRFRLDRTLRYTPVAGC